MYFRLIIIVLILSKTNAKPSSIICQAKQPSEYIEATDYDCSGLNVSWQSLQQIIESTFTATSLNLANNNFDPIIRNKSFDRFKLLKTSLNLSSNKFEQIESHAFYYNIQLVNSNNETGSEETSKISILDLSNNKFKLIPWTAVKSLSNLQHLYLSHNSINCLNISKLKEINSETFSSLTHLYLDSNSMESIDNEILKYLTKLLLLDLSSNKLKTLDPQIGQTLSFNQHTQLNVSNNELECNCKLLWLKKYLIQHGNDISQTCIVREPIKAEYSLPTVVKAESIHLDKTSEIIEHELDQLVYSENTRNQSIINLTDEEFYCDLEFIEANTTRIDHIKDNIYNIQLTCVVKGYPKPIIRWNEGFKSLDKNIDNSLSITNSQSDPNYIDRMFVVTSKLELHKPFGSLDVYNNYSCRVKHETADDSQKMAVFQIYNPKSGLNSRQQLSAQKISDQQETKLNLNKKSDTYWLVLLFCILIALIFILFASICIIRNVVQSYKLEKKIIEKEKVFNRNSTYSTVARRPDTTYSASTTTSTTRNSAVGLLKPDIIRPHQDFNSNYNVNSNRTPSSRQSSPNSNTNTFFFSSPISLAKQTQAELDNLLSNQSYDMNPVAESSLFYDDNLSNSSKSFDENIEQYQEPEFDDLRKPASKQ